MFFLLKQVSTNHNPNTEFFYFQKFVNDQSQIFGD
jgi:hypothetical protein